MTWPTEHADTWHQLAARAQRRAYPPAELAHREYQRVVTEAAAAHGMTEREYVRNLFHWGWEP